MAEKPGDKPAEKGTPREIIVALLLLTFTTGIVDAVSLLGLGRVFVANMTGNVVLLGFALAGASGFSILATLSALVGFTVGAGFGAHVGSTRGSPVRGWLPIALSVEVALLVISALLAIGLAVDTDSSRRFLVIFLMASAMGARNAAVRDLAVKDLTTTVVTMTLTGLLADPKGRHAGGSSSARRIAAVASMLIGAVIGALLVIHVGLALPLFVAAGCAAVGLVMVLRIEEPAKAAAT